MLADSLTLARDGVGYRWAAVLGASCECLAKVQLALLQLFVARGRCFLRSPDEFTRRLVVQVLILVYVCIAVGSEIYEQYFARLDWSTMVYFYSSKPGAVTLFLNVALFLDVVRSTRQLLSKSDLLPQLRKFYLRTAICAGLYFLALPAVVLLATLVAPWVRRKVVERVEILSRLVVCCLLTYCFWPSRLDSLIDADLDQAAEAAEKRQKLEPLTEAGASLQPTGSMQEDEESPAVRAEEES